MTAELAPIEEISKRRMPDNLRRFFIRMQGGKMYLPAAYRIVWFRDELGDDWGIKTDLLEGGHEAGFATVRAEILNPEGRVVASGMKTEAKTDFPAGWVEKAESGAIARALGFLGFGTQFVPELDDDGYRPADSPQAVRPQGLPEGVGHSSPAPVADVPVNRSGGQCPYCHAPAGKPHTRTCNRQAQDDPTDALLTVPATVTTRNAQAEGA